MRRKRDALDYFRFDVVAYLTSPDVTVMTAAQEGAYVRLLAFASRAKDCAIPNDEDKLAKLSKLGSDWLTEGRLVREQFQEVVGDSSRLINEKLHAEWSSAWVNYKARCKRNRANALKRSESLASGKRVASDTKATAHVKGKGTGTGTIALTDAVPSLAPAGAEAPAQGELGLVVQSPRSWSDDACGLWKEYLGSVKSMGGRIAGALKPLVEENPWPVIRPLWVDALQDAVTWDDPGRFTPEIFARAFKARMRGKVGARPGKTVSAILKSSEDFLRLHGKEPKRD
jgi:hypothetical protein